MVVLAFHFQLAVDDRTFKQILEILMHTVRLGPIDTNEITTDLMDQFSSWPFSGLPQPSVCSLGLLIELTDLWNEANLPVDREFNQELRSLISR